METNTVAILRLRHLEFEVEEERQDF